MRRHAAGVVSVGRATFFRTRPRGFDSVIGHATGLLEFIYFDLNLADDEKGGGRPTPRRTGGRGGRKRGIKAPPACEPNPPPPPNWSTPMSWSRLDQSQ